jgi:hypothetical protein
MKLKTLDEFLALGWENPRFPKAEYVTHPDFVSLYVRIGPRYIRTTMPPHRSDGEMMRPVLTLASIEIEMKGEGRFSRFLDELRAKYPWPIFVECVQTERFRNYLERRGFVQIAAVPGDYVILPGMPLKPVCCFINAG